MLSSITRRIATRTTRRFLPHVQSQQQQQQQRFLSSLPDHTIMPMPALSPTMSSGTIAQWNVSEGQAFSAGDSIAEIETDKATMDFEAQDDGIVAKILVESGSAEVEVGVPVLVVVEEEEDVAAFKDYVAEEAPKKEEEAEEPKPSSTPTVAAVEPEPVVEAVPPPSPPTVNEPAVVELPPVVDVAAVSATVPLSPSWGNLAQVRSPLAKSLSKQQTKYVEMFGSTGQVPL